MDTKNCGPEMKKGFQKKDDFKEKVMARSKFKAKKAPTTKKAAVYLA